MCSTGQKKQDMLGGVNLYRICIDEVIFQLPRTAAEARKCLQNTAEVGRQQMLSSIWVIAQNWMLLIANSSLLAYASKGKPLHTNV